MVGIGQRHALVAYSPHMALMEHVEDIGRTTTEQSETLQ
jgi:hypothetical protein